MPDTAPGLPRARAVVDLDRLAQNYRAVAAFAGTPLMPVVKADAYGHGAGQVGRLLEELGAPLLAVAHVDEGVGLRAQRVSVPIAVLAGVAPSQLAACAESALVPVVSTPALLEAVLAREPSATPLDVHVEIDTGMSRLGFPAADALDVLRRLADSGRVTIGGLMTHLACADENAEATERQLEAFDAAIDAAARHGIRPRWLHACNSAGLAFRRASHTLARPGLLLYGLRPRPLSPELPVRPVMRLSAEISLVKQVAAGTSVSYGARWTAERPSRIATVALGYADGVPRTDAMAREGGFGVGGRIAPVAGNVCMDLSMLDVTGLPGVAAGDEAVLFGDAPTAWDVARWAGTNAWQVLTGVGSRVPRVYLRAGQIVAIESR